MPRPVSLRGTGTIISAASSGQNCGAGQTTGTAPRPTVPPPERPATSALISDAAKAFNSERECKSADDFDTKSSHSLTSSSNVRGDFEEISANEVEEIDLSTQSNSPVVSLDTSISGDSSFDNENDNTSLDRSWTKCFAPSAQTSKQQDELDESRSGTLKLIVRNFAHDDQSTVQQQQSPPPDSKSGIKSISAHSSEGQPNEQVIGESAPPMKPHRGASPKITQSTPL